MISRGQSSLSRILEAVCISYSSPFRLCGSSDTFGLLVQGAIDWLEKNQDKSLEEITATSKTDQKVESPSQASTEEARSLVCNDCGKTFRTQEQAEFHATKSGHVDFSESTAEIAPLTEAEKKAKLEEIKERLAQRRSGASEKDKLEQKKNEVCT